MIGTAMPPLNLVSVIVVEPAGRDEAPRRRDEAPAGRAEAAEGPTIVADEDGRAAAEAALTYERAAVWVGDAGTPAYEEFRDEIGRPR
jgi:hypothetical protein